MHRVIIVAFDGVQTLDATGPAEVFAATNRQLGSRAYAIVLAAVGGGTIGTSSGISLCANDLRRLRARSGDTVIVAGGEDEPLTAAATDEVCLGWVRRFTHVRRLSIPLV